MSFYAYYLFYYTCSILNYQAYVSHLRQCHKNAKNKIDSYELVTKIKDDFNVNMYIYDKGVRYFNKEGI